MTTLSIISPNFFYRVGDFFLNLFKRQAGGSILLLANNNKLRIGRSIVRNQTC
jgi:hypothetical protein